MLDLRCPAARFCVDRAGDRRVPPRPGGPSGALHRPARTAAHLVHGGEREQDRPDDDRRARSPPRFPIPDRRRAPVEITVGPGRQALVHGVQTGTRSGASTAPTTISEFPALGQTPTGSSPALTGTCGSRESGSNQVGRTGHALRRRQSLTSYALSAKRARRHHGLGPTAGSGSPRALGNSDRRDHDHGQLHRLQPIPTAQGERSVGDHRDGRRAVVHRVRGQSRSAASARAGRSRSSRPTGPEPSGIATGSDGALWFTETTPQHDRANDATTGTLTNEFHVPTWKPARRDHRRARTAHCGSPSRSPTRSAASRSPRRSSRRLLRRPRRRPSARRRSARCPSSRTSRSRRRAAS